MMIKLTAGDGMILTDGMVYGKEFYLAKNRNKEEFHEIPIEEYKKLTSENEELTEV